MKIIGEQKLWSYPHDSDYIQQSCCDDIRKDDAHKVHSYIELASKIAELQYKNKEHALLFRGQVKEYRDRKKNTTLKPSILRAVTNPSKIPKQHIIEKRFETLIEAETKLIGMYKNTLDEDSNYIEKYHLARWAILQHYEVCRTPLLDVTHSLRIAASFASMHSSENAHLFVIGVPNLSGAITASAEACIQIIRLASICPPTALRPHLQEGYLLGEYPEITSSAQRTNYKHYEIDFGRRLIAKFQFDSKSFWSDNSFPMVKHDALYPSPESDPLYNCLQKIKKSYLILNEATCP